MVTVEQILDLLADTLINAPEVDLPMVRQNQKTIRDGLIQLGRDNSEKLILFERDVKANEEDFTDVNTEGDSLTSIVESLQDLDISQCQFHITFDTSGETPIISSIVLDANTNTFDMTNIFYNGNPNGNPINLSQFMNLQELTQNIDVGLAEEYLDTTIFELLPDITLRQQRIINFFNEFQNLAGNPPSFPQTGLIDVDENGVFLNNDIYSENHDISTAQDGDPAIGIQEEDSFITRLEQDANSNNEQYTLEGLRNTLNTYLKDIDQELPPLQDERPTYRNQSSGYLKFRNLNQGIIIRNTENEFVQGLDPNNPTWLNTGFSITMWVKFLDKSSQGTLFNYGNPFRENQNEAFGFSLETYVLKRDDTIGVDGYDNALADNTWGEVFQDGNQLDLTYDDAAPSEGFFNDDNAERFIRLVVKDENKLRGSHVGMPFLNRREGLPEFNTADLFSEPPDGFEIGDLPYEHTFGLMTNTRVPIDYSEWYFICATYNPNIREDLSHSDNGIYDVYKNNSDFWRGNLFPGGDYTHHSTYGARCKVEIISKTDLLRARGFKVD
tara:strand:+ start:218 stop:1882 length:1665 start_codon:yes stop_codon:yes gene_type:complete